MSVEHGMGIEWNALIALGKQVLLTSMSPKGHVNSSMSTTLESSFSELSRTRILPPKIKTTTNHTTSLLMISIEIYQYIIFLYF